ncbi:hypothetical protein ACPV30_06100 [Photobacterium damselae]|uniref:hypothetical protein n=1 Tax=Photobacterium damselae TaxID=38293 RepID=UPI002341995D|nr:hypothetical protein [Photobacterium damselae]EHA1081715.1 hypothetical protein [Photobacterium damselae]MDC4170069.1 hypothetical protein [Photobacterium damselae]
MTQLSLEAIRQQLTERHFHADKVKIVTVEAMEPADLESCTTVENETFYNSYMNVIYGKGDRYVLGYRCNEAEIIDQAIIRKGDKYYDPTLQANSDNFEPYQFALLTEFQVFDMMKNAKSNKDFPPDVDFLFARAKYYKNIINK